MNLKIALVQFQIDPLSPEANLKKAERFIEVASPENDLIVFPEDFIAGPLNGRNEFADYDSRYVRRFQRLAAKYKIDIVPGSIIEGDDAALYNTTYYIDRGGEILGRYRKVNLWLPERSYITAGNKVSVFATRFGKVGLIICWDLMFPEIFRTMVREGVEIVICPSYWCFEDAGIGLKHNRMSEVKLVNALCVSRAFENEIALVYVNAAARLAHEGATDTLIGQSQVTVPFKGAIALMDHNQEEMLFVEINTDILRDAEEAYEIRSDLRKGVMPL